MNYRWVDSNRVNYSGSDPVYKIVTEPTVEPMTLAEFKAHARIDHFDDDTYISSFIIPAARRHVENYTRRSLLTQTWDMWLDYFPVEIELLKGPIQSVGSVTYVDTDGVSQTLSTDVYTADTDSDPGRIYEAYSQVWPTTRDIRKAVTVRFTSGYGNASTDVPESLVMACKVIGAELYENREVSVTGTITSKYLLSAENLMRPYTVATF